MKYLAMTLLAAATSMTGFAYADSAKAPSLMTDAQLDAVIGGESLFINPPGQAPNISQNTPADLPQKTIQQNEPLDPGNAGGSLLIDLEAII